MLKATDEERANHEKYLDNMEKETGGKAVWRGREKDKPSDKKAETGRKQAWYDKAMG